MIHGSKGSAGRAAEGPAPRHLQGAPADGRELDLAVTKGRACNAYQMEHDLLFEAIRQDKPYNETERCAKAAMAGILGRMAAESGKMITWDEAMASNLELAPGLDQYTMASSRRCMPDAQGHYPIAMPGMTKVL